MSNPWRRPEEYPDHATWIADVTAQLRQDGFATVTVEGGSPIELERRRQVLVALCEREGIDLDVNIDVDTLVIDR